MDNQPGKEKILDKSELVQMLIDTGKVDTVYRDIYLERARSILSAALTREDYHDFLKQRERMSKLPKRISSAMEKNDWSTVKDLSRWMGELQKWLEKNQNIYELGREVYDISNIVINPFSPGFNHIAGIPAGDLPAFRDQVDKQLITIMQQDPDYEKFYSSRRIAFGSMSFHGIRDLESDNIDLGENELQVRAEQALYGGDMELLEDIAELLLKKKSVGNKLFEIESFNEITEESLPERLFTFTKQTLSKAGHLGLIAARVEKSPDYASLCHFAIHPMFDEKHNIAWDNLKMGNQDIPEGLKKCLELHATHTFINSGGTAHFPDFASEDFLVEDFPEQPVSNEYPQTELLSMLGLDNRKALSRIDIEQSLFRYGPRIVREELELDPEYFRLVCIPSDLYSRLGDKFNWGRQEIWTHFDGYEISRSGKFNALAGGDIRFGGRFDLVNIGREYESDRVIARFAVVQRKRMELGKR